MSQPSVGGPPPAATGGPDIGGLSWEDCVNDSVVNGNVGKLDGVSQSWDAIFRNGGTVRDELQTVVKDLDDWKGPAGETYRKNISKIVDALDKISETNKPKVTGLLDECSSALKTLQSEMPIPSEMYDQVQGYRKQANDRNAQVAGGLLLHNPIGAVATHYLMPDSLKNTLFNNRAADWVGDKVSVLTDWVDDKVRGRTEQARDILRTANDNYGVAADHAGSPGNVPSLYETGADAYGNGGSPSGAGGAGAPGTGVGGGIPDTKSPDVGGTGYHDPSSTIGAGDDPNGDGDYGTTDPPGHGGDGSWGDGSPGSGLGGSGYDGSGLAGAGGGPSGLGSGAGPAGGVGAAGSGGSGPVGLAGKPVDMGSPAPGAGGAAGRGAMMAGRGMRGGGMGSAETHETWLTEDEDPWGGDQDAAPSVLGN